MNVILDAVGDTVLKLFDEEGTPQHRGSTRLSRRNRRDRIQSEKKSKGRSRKDVGSTGSTYESSVSSSTLVTTGTSAAGRSFGTSIAQSTIGQSTIGQSTIGQSTLGQSTVGSREGLWLKHQKSSSISQSFNERFSSARGIAPNSRRREVSVERRSSFNTALPPVSHDVEAVRTAKVARDERNPRESSLHRVLVNQKNFSDAKSKSSSRQTGTGRKNVNFSKFGSEERDAPLTASSSTGTVPEASSKDTIIPPRSGIPSLRENAFIHSLGLHSIPPLGLRGSSSVPDEYVSSRAATKTDQAHVAPDLRSSTIQRNNVQAPANYQERQKEPRINQLSSRTRSFHTIKEEEEEEEAKHTMQEVITQVDDLLARVREAEEKGRVYMKELETLQSALNDLDISRIERGSETFEEGDQEMDYHRYMAEQRYSSQGQHPRTIFPRDSIDDRNQGCTCVNIIPDSFTLCGRKFNSSGIDDAYVASQPNVVYRESRDLDGLYAENGHPYARSSQIRSRLHPDHLMVPHLDGYAEGEVERMRLSAQNPYHQYASNQVVPGKERRNDRYIAEDDRDANNRFAHFYGERPTLSSSEGQHRSNEPAPTPSFEGRTVVIYPRTGPETSREASVNVNHHQARPRYMSYPVNAS